METITLNIKGMTCMGCVKSVNNILEAIAGVSAVDVSLEKGQATIEYDPAQTDAVQFRSAVHDAGFEVVA